eukprot:380938-Prymnesium_polylepis.1
MTGVRIPVQYARAPRGHRLQLVRWLLRPGGRRMVPGADDRRATRLWFVARRASPGPVEAHIWLRRQPRRLPPHTAPSEARQTDICDPSVNPERNGRLRGASPLRVSALRVFVV